MSPETGSKSITHTLAGSMTKRAVTPVAGTAAAAVSTYVARKWHHTIAPAIEAKGGPRAALAEALETVAEKVPDVISPTIRDLARHVSGDKSQAKPRTEKPAASAGDDDREAQREERKKRRQERQRALQRSGTS